MVRPILSFFSALAIGTMAAALLIALAPWATMHAPSGLKPAIAELQFNSLIIGLLVGLTLGSLGRYNWSDIPRRAVTWFLVRERQMFYYTLVAICGVVLFFY
jgi:uncharacterized membrane protein YphA (DoxX/SURF4 family)